MKKIGFIVGNGLDISLKMETSYAEFYDHVEAQKTNSENSIYNAISGDRDTWAAFEYALGIHTQYLEGFDKDKELAAEINKFHDEFDEVLGDLGDYLQAKQDDLPGKNLYYTMQLSDFYRGLSSGLTRRIESLIANHVLEMNFIILNYTNSVEYLLSDQISTAHRKGMHLRSFHHAHGELSEYISIGVSDASQISPVLQGRGGENIIKPSVVESMEDDRLATTYELIDRSDIIVLFGVSIGATDTYLWNRVIEWMRRSESNIVVLHEYRPELLKKPTRNPAVMKQYDSEAQDKLLIYATELNDEEKLALRKQIYVVKNTANLFASKKSLVL